MKWLDDYRDPASVKQLLTAIATITRHPWRIMEVCGGQTHSIIKHGLDQLLPAEIELIHGPGCPVCVTPISVIDQALQIAAQNNVVFCSFGDMLRVPGSNQDLLSLKAQGADIRIVYSPLDCLELAKAHPHQQVVFFGVGFETTAPTTALLAQLAQQQQLQNLSLLVSHARVPPVMKALLSAKNCQVQGLLGAGHVCAIMGYHEYLSIAQCYATPIVITGFEPVDILQGLYLCIQQLEQGRHQVENQFRRVVSEAGNRVAQQQLATVFDVVDQEWRGLGLITNSGLALNARFAPWNAALRFNLPKPTTPSNPLCRSGEILQGWIKPPQCPQFAVNCTPERPLGATMVSSEGACAAYYRFRNHD